MLHVFVIERGGVITYPQRSRSGSGKTKAHHILDTLLNVIDVSCRTEDTVAGLPRFGFQLSQEFGIRLMSACRLFVVTEPKTKRKERRRRMKGEQMKFSVAAKNDSY